MVLAAMGTFAGCGTSRPTSSSNTVAVPPAAAAAEPAGSQVPAATTAADSDIEKGLAELSPEDRELARKQKVCPVSGEPLGGMGKPYKVTVKGRTVFLCCSGCEEEIKADPDKYLAKIGAVAKK
jgi:YHS domain-containing protein